MTDEEYRKLIRKFNAVTLALGCPDRAVDFAHAYVAFRLAGGNPLQSAHYFCIDQLRSELGSVGTARSAANVNTVSIDQPNLDKLDMHQILPGTGAAEIERTVEARLAIERVPDWRRREIAFLYFFCDWSPRELAKRYAITTSRVMQLIHSSFDHCADRQPEV